MAYELIVRADPAAESRLAAGLLNDPSLELRYDAVALALEQAAGQIEKDRPAAIAAYQTAFAAARDVQQVKQAADKLSEMGVQVDLPRHYGFLREWKLIGPFENTDGRGYRLAYPPEQEINLNAVYPGKVGDVAWIEHATTDSYGIVDLNAAYDRPRATNGSRYADTPESLRKCKGAVAYAYTEFVSDAARGVELRLGSRNGHRVWLNGELLFENNVYHTAMAVDHGQHGDGAGHPRPGGILYRRTGRGAARGHQGCLAALGTAASARAPGTGRPLLVLCPQP